MNFGTHGFPQGLGLNNGLLGLSNSSEILKSDPFLEFVSLHLKAEGANNSIVFTDSSTNKRSIIRIGDPIISSSTAKYGSSSIYFDGVNDWLEISYNPHTFTQNITLECWVYPTTLDKQAIFDLSNSVLNGLRVYTDAVGALVQQVVVNSVFVRPNFILNNWNHFAVSVYRNNYRVFTNGILIDSSVSISPLLTSTGVLYIGTVNTGTVNFQGYIDSFRVTEACRYIKNFNPETDTYLDY